MEERDVLRGRIRDLWNRTQQGDYLNHTGFLSPDLQSYARQVIREEKIPLRAGAGAWCAFSGGYEEADRQMLFFVPSYTSEEEMAEEIAGGEGALTCIRIAAVRSGFAEPPSHRDYLGSLIISGSPGSRSEISSAEETRPSCSRSPRRRRLSAARSRE
ncbi:MAG: hypothetical protein IJ107_04815 [Lachnospiraceae bacterium]|nr:hypothetical protein [Lachnospiraceae bacterium]